MKPVNVKLKPEKPKRGMQEFRRDVIVATLAGMVVLLIPVSFWKSISVFSSKRQVNSFEVLSVLLTVVILVLGIIVLSYYVHIVKSR